MGDALSMGDLGVTAFLALIGVALLLSLVADFPLELDLSVLTGCIFAMLTL